ncbi:MAG: sensor protein [Candidatus Berkelbacteria bacterium Athens1014_28]|uniref:Sensor protein n=1 Tax=Candidatus Berkelbacteria bacterium Athens1014_28 TaxID=2017145 RepID=A0A554LP97_9BACT|nr:MAG: sensor protein [Candidatus Berkelbacteria bacterium Athens1014_28]
MAEKKLSKREKFRKYLDIFFSSIVLLSFGMVLMILVIYYYNKSFEKQQADFANRYAMVIKNETNLYVDEAERVLLSISRLPETEKSGSQSCQKELSQILIEAKIFANIAIAEKDGHFSCAARSEALNLNVFDRSYFQKAVESKSFVIGGYILSRATSERMMIFSYPLLNDKKEVEKVLVAGIKVAELEKNLKEIELTEGFAAAIVDSNGTLLAEAPITDSVGKPYKNQRIFLFALENGRGMINDFSDNERKKVSILPSDDGSYFIIVSAPVRSFISTASHLGKKYWLVVLFPYILILIPFVLLRKYFGCQQNNAKK